MLSQNNPRFSGTMMSNKVLVIRVISFLISPLDALDVDGIHDGAWLSLDEETRPGTDRTYLPQRTLVTQVQTAALSHQRCHQQMSLRDPEDVALPALSTC